MANKKINELVSRVPSLTDLMLVGDPSSGYSYKCTVSALATIIETDISDAFVTLGTTQTISGAKTFSNVLTLTSVANSATDTDKFLVLNASNVVNYRTGAEVLSDIGGASASSISGTTNYVSKFTSSSAIGNSQIFDNGTNVGIGTTTPTQKLDVNGDASFNGVRVGRGASNSVVNTVVGNNSMNNVTTGTDNTAMGYGALAALTSGIKNTSMGISALTANTSGSLNTAIGESALNSNTSGGNNIGIGSESMKFNTTGGFNVGVGNGAIAYNTSGTYNTSLGYDAGKSPVNAGQFNQTGTYNLYLGSLTRAGGNGNSTNEIVIGAQADGNGSNTATLGNTSITNTYLRGAINLNTVANATTDTDKFLVSDGGTIKYRTGSELLSDIGGASASSISGTTNYIPKFTSSSAIGNSVLQESSSNIGVGGSPSYPLDIYTGGGRVFFVNNSGANFIGSINSTNTAYNDLQINGASLQFLVNASEQMRLTSTGLGIGTTSIVTPLTTYGLSANPSLSANQGILTLTNQSSVQLQFGGIADSPYTFWLQTKQTTNSGASFPLALNPLGGNVGIGTSSPSRLLDLSSSSSNGTAINIANSATNGRTYVIGSNFVTGNGEFSIYDATASAERLRLTASGNLGLGVTPSAWGSPLKAFQVVNAGMYGTTGDLSQASITGNAYYDGSVFRYISTAAAQRYTQTVGQHQWYTAPSGTAGNAISFTQAMTLDASGNLGVGSTAPSTPLAGARGLVLNGGSISDVQFRLQNTTTGSGNTDGGLFSISGTTMYFWNYENDATVFGTNNTERMRITSGGNVGIGTTAPSSLSGYGVVSLNGTTGSLFNGMSNGTSASYFGTDPSSTFVYELRNAFLGFGTNNTERMRITSGGNVGIGTTSPGDKLQVNGDVSISATSRYYLDAGTGGLSIRGSAANGDMQFYSNYTERMRIKSSGVINLSNVPSDSTGLATGDIYRDGDGYLKIVL